MHDENGIRRFALWIFFRFPQCPIMQTQLPQRLAGSKFEIANRVIAFLRRRIIGGRCEIRGQDGEEKWEDSDCWIHLNDSVGARLGFV